MESVVDSDEDDDDEEEGDELEETSLIGTIYIYDVRNNFGFFDRPLVRKFMQPPLLR